MPAEFAELFRSSHCGILGYVSVTVKYKLKNINVYVQVNIVWYLQAEQMLQTSKSATNRRH